MATIRLATVAIRTFHPLGGSVLRDSSGSRRAEGSPSTRRTESPRRVACDYVESDVEMAPVVGRSLEKD